jgi:SAM-dependent methyltransferase
VKFRLAADVVVDRHYRGAVALAAGQLHELDEASARVVDACQWSEDDAGCPAEIVAELERRGILVVVRDAAGDARAEREHRDGAGATQAPTPSHGRIYEHAELYAYAFGTRDVPRECRFLREVLARHGRGGPGDRGPELTRFLELGAGPADHAIELARAGVGSTAIDISPAMVAFGRGRASQAGVALDYREADMRDFRCPEQVELAATLLDTASYLLTNHDFRTHLAAVARAVRPGGVYVLELSHPRDLFTSDSSTESQWSVDTPSGPLHVEWRLVPGSFDPIRQTATYAAKFEYHGSAGSQVVTQEAVQRAYTSNEIEALVAACPAFELAARYGALDVSVPFDNARAAWRMIVVLRRV